MLHALKAAAGRWLANVLSAPVKGSMPLTTSDPQRFGAALRRGDVVLVEGNSRVASAIKYLTQSTWSHAALYVGEIAGRAEPNGEPHVFVEAEPVPGVISAPLSKYAMSHTRICRPIGISEREVERIVAFAMARIGITYDLRNVFDLARYLLPTPPVPTRMRRRMLALGSGSPTRAICSTLIAQAFDSIRYPVLPRIEIVDDGSAGERTRHERAEIAHIRHYSLYAPRDFDISPYFSIVKPTIELGFDYHAIQWAPEEEPADPPS